MSGICFGLRAKNSGEDLFLVFNKQVDGSITPTMFGVREGEDIQIDFDELSTSDVNDLIHYLEHRASGEQNVE